MTPSVTYAEHGSWRCWLSRDDPEAPLLELVWQISGMVPRVLLQVGQGAECDCSVGGTSRAALATVEGPSGHRYELGLSPHLVEVTEEVLGEWGNGEGGGVRLLQAGSDIDTSEVIVRRALDLLRRALGTTPDSQGLFDMLRDRSDAWATW